MTRTLFFLLLAVLMPPWLGQCQYKVYRQDPFALLSGTLQTYQEASCDNEALSLECPTGTKISIQLVQYGRSAPSAQVGLLHRSTSRLDFYTSCNFEFKNLVGIVRNLTGALNFFFVFMY